MDDRNYNANPGLLFPPVKYNTGVIQLPSLPAVSTDIFMEEGRVIPAVIAPKIKTLIDAIVNSKPIEQQTGQYYIHKKDFNPVLKIAHSFIRIGEDDFVVIKKVIGEGQQQSKSQKRNEVLLVQNIQTGEVGVVKKIGLGDVENLDTKAIDQIGLETKALNAIEGSPKTAIRKQSKHKQEYAYIFMKLAPGIELDTILDIEKDRDPNEFLSRPVISPLVRVQLGLNIIKQEIKLSERGYWHLDLKSRNIMVDLSKQLAALIDYGMSREMDKDSGTVNLSYVTGTSVYLPAEIRAQAASQPASKEAVAESIVENEKEASEKNQIQYNEKTEVYALGITLAELFGLFDKELAFRVYKKPLNEWLDISLIFGKDSEAFKNNCSMPKAALAEIHDLILGMTNANPNERFDLAKSLETLETIKKKYFAEATVKMGVIDIDQFSQKGAEGQMAILEQFAEMRPMNKGEWQERKVDEIVLVDTSGKSRDVSEYLNLKQEIEGALLTDDARVFNLVVANEVITGANPSLLEANLTNYIKQRELPSEYVGSPFTPKLEPQEATAPAKSFDSK